MTFRNILLLFAASCCDAFNVDYYDQKRRLTRVQYDPTVETPRIATHSNSDRRLDDAGAAEPVPDVTLMVVNPEELYVHINDTAVVIYGTDFELDEHMWSSERDLVVKGAKVHLPSRMKFYPDASGRQHSVHVHAMEISVPEAGTTIELKGSNGLWPDMGLPASSGEAPGDSGEDGLDGGAGAGGGVVTIETMTISGGIIDINVDGGAGGKGQDGGDGAVGTVGQRRDDTDNCCERERDRKSPAGNAGGDGGAAGMGGNGGAGGTAGFVRLLVAKPVDANETQLEDGQHPHVLISALPGAGGASGKAGEPGAGGSGGPGVMTKCRRVDWFFFNRICTFPVGPDGEDGSAGTDALNGTAGSIGTLSERGLSEVAEKSVQEIRAEGNDYNLRYELYLADKNYKNGNWVEAQKIYYWIEAVYHTVHNDEEEGTEDLPWRQIALEASVRLTQLSHGLDFWGHQMNHVPMVSFEALESTMPELLRIAAKNEEVYERYYQSATTAAERQSFITKAAKNIDFEISEKDVAINELIDPIISARGEIRDLQAEQEVQRQIVLDNAAQCDGGIAKKVAGDAHKFAPNVNRLITMVTNGVTTFQRTVGLQTVAMGVWSTMTGNIPGLLSLLRDVGRQAGQAGWDAVVDANVEGAWPAMRTVVQGFVNTQVSSVRDPFSDAWDRISEGIESVEGTARAKNTAIDGIKQVTNMLLDAKEYMATREKYFDSVEECFPLSGHFRQLVGISKQLTIKRAEHDMKVVKFGALQSQRSRLVSEKRELYNSAAGTFDPTSLQFMQTISETYRAQKDRIVEMLKLMHEAVDYEFCEQDTFAYEDVRVTQLESFTAQISAERMRRHSDDTAARALLAEHGPGDSMEAVTVVTLKEEQSAEVAMAFINFWENGTLSFNIDTTHDAFPRGVANMRVVSAQAFVPALLLAEEGQHDYAKVWFRKLGVSTCSSSEGQQHTFAHPSTGYYSVYSAREDPRLNDGPPAWLTKPIQNDDIVAPTPFGAWSMSIPALKTQAQRSVVNEVELHFVLSYVPCSKGSCADDSVQQEL